MNFLALLYRLSFFKKDIVDASNNQQDAAGNTKRVFIFQKDSKKMGECIAANNQKHIYSKNTEDECKAATPSIVKALFYNGEQDRPY